MPATMMDGRALAERIRAEVAEEVRVLGGVGLATVLVGDDAASEIYIRRKHEAAEAAGFRADDLRLPATIAEAELLERVSALNADNAVDALLVQLPLPDGIDEERVIRAVDPQKDVDGFHPLNAGELLLARPRRPVAASGRCAARIAPRDRGAVERRVELVLVHLQPAAKRLPGATPPRPALLALDQSRRLSVHVRALTEALVSHRPRLEREPGLDARATHAQVALQ